MGALETVKNQSKDSVKKAGVKLSPEGAPGRTEEIKDKAEEIKEKVIETSKSMVNRAREAVQPGLTDGLVRRVRRLVRLGLGALALLNDERKTLARRCIERGEVVESDTREATTKLYKEFKRLARREKDERKAA